MGRAMKIVLGAGGVAHEVAWLMSGAQRAPHGEIRPDAFVVSDADWAQGSSVHDVPVMSESQILSIAHGHPVDTYLAVGMPVIKRRALAAIQERLICSFPNLIHPEVSLHNRASKINIGKGTIIYPRASLTTEIRIGDFVHINPCVTVAHHCHIGNFTTLCPGSLISGHVSIGAGCFVGAGAIIKDGVTIANDCLIGAGAVVLNDITEPGTWIGIPARRLEP